MHGTDGKLAPAGAAGLDHPVDPADRLAMAFLLSYREGNTRDAYRRDLADWWRWCADQGLDPLQARRVHVDAYARTLEQQGHAHATVRRRLAVLSSFYRYAVAEGAMAVNPLAHVRRPPADDASTTLGLDRAEAVRFLDAAAAAGPRDHALACLLLLGGLRVNEVLAVDVDQLGTDRGHQVLAVTAKGGHRRLVPLAPRTAHAIAEHLAGRIGGPLLLANDGRRLTRQQAARVVARLARRAGIPKRVSPHSLGHTAITLALDDGASLRVVQASVGHADPKTTVRYDRAGGAWTTTSPTGWRSTSPASKETRRHDRPSAAGAGRDQARRGPADGVHHQRAAWSQVGGGHPAGLLPPGAADHERRSWSTCSPRTPTWSASGGSVALTGC